MQGENQEQSSSSSESGGKFEVMCLLYIYIKVVFFIHKGATVQWEWMERSKGKKGSPHPLSQ